MSKGSKNSTNGGTISFVAGIASLVSFYFFPIIGIIAGLFGVYKGFTLSNSDSYVSSNEEAGAQLGVKMSFIGIFLSFLRMLWLFNAFNV